MPTMRAIYQFRGGLREDTPAMQSDILGRFRGILASTRKAVVGALPGNAGVRTNGGRRSCWEGLSGSIFAEPSTAPLRTNA